MTAPDSASRPRAGSRALPPSPLLSLAVLSILAGSLHAATVPFQPDDLFPGASGGNTNLFTVGGNYAPLVHLLTVGLAGMLSLIALAYMASGFFKNAEWEALAKSELYQTVVTVVWALLFIGVAFAADGITGRYAHSIDGTSNSVFDVAHGYLNQVICLSSATTLKIQGMQMASQYIAGMKSKFYASAWGITIPTFPGWDVIERSLDLIMMFITPFTSSLFVQSIGLEVIRATAIVLVLPAGILLRLAPFSRDAGSLLIAVAFGFYFVFPFTYVLYAPVMRQMYLFDTGHPMCGADSTLTTAAGATTLYDSLSVQLIPKADDILGFSRNLSYVALQAVFLPSLSMILTVSFMRAAMKFFSQKMDG